MPLPASGNVYELWLTRGGEPVAICGSFVTEEDGNASVPMNAPWPLDKFDGWIVVEAGLDDAGPHDLTPVLTT